MFASPQPCHRHIIGDGPQIGFVPHAPAGLAEKKLPAHFRLRMSSQRLGYSTYRVVLFRCFA